MPYGVHVGSGTNFRSGRRDLRALRQARRHGEQRRDVARLRLLDRCHREALRHRGEPEPQGPFRLSALAGADGRRRRQGDHQRQHASVAAAAPSYLPYAAAKAGAQCAHRGLAKAYGPTVRVNTLMPGPFLTDISKAWALETTVAGTSARSPATPCSAREKPREIVGAALFLMSDASSYPPDRSCTPTVAFRNVASSVRTHTPARVADESAQSTEAGPWAIRGRDDVEARIGRSSTLISACSTEASPLIQAR